MAFVLDLIILCSFLFISCENTKTKIDNYDLYSNTHQIVKYQGSIIRIRKPAYERDCCSSIQILNQKMQIQDEIQFDIGCEPDISIQNDSIFLVCLYSVNEYESIIDYDKRNVENKRQLGQFQLYYTFEKIVKGGLRADSLDFDSLVMKNEKLTFIKNGTQITEREIQEVFYDNFAFYFINQNEGVFKKVVLIPGNDKIFIDFMNGLFE
jgi:hypothetical protein